MIEIQPIPAFEDNYIWIFKDPASNSACVVDPGDSDAVEEFLQSNNLRLTHVLITHHHPDHVGGVLDLAKKYEPTIYGPTSSGIKGITQAVQENDIVSIFGFPFSVLEVPGHTLDHVAYFSNSSETPILFCGDTLFAAGCGRLFEGTPTMMHDSLGKLSQLPEETLVFCTHEYTLANLKFAIAANPNNIALSNRMTLASKIRQSNKPTLPSTIGLELETNPFLRCNDSDILKTLSSRTDSSMHSEVEAFTALRQWKDQF